MRSTLIITSTPHRSSPLTVPSSPFTPRIATSPPRNTQRPKPTTTTPKFTLSVPPPPPEPQKWLWQCHLCGRLYDLGTTRRCLDDNHYFCAGGIVIKVDRKTGRKISRKTSPCVSEFDYQRWKAWGTWRRDVEEQRAAAEALKAFDDIAVESDGEMKVEDVDMVVTPRRLFADSAPSEMQWLDGAWTRKPAVAEATLAAFWEKDCWNGCDYPSECRWGKQFRQAQLQAQAQAQVVVAPPPPPPPSMAAEPVAKDLEQPSKSFENLSSLPTMIEEMPEAETSAPHDHSHDHLSATAQESTKKPTFDDLLESSKRRRRRSAGPLPSALASNPPEQEETPIVSAHTLQKAFDDFELDFEKPIGRASVLFNGFVHGLKATGSEEEDKAEAFVKGVKVDRKKKRAVKEEDGQSLSD